MTHKCFPIILLNNWLTLPSRSLNCLLEQGLFKLEKGESHMWGQRKLCFMAAIRIHLLVKIHHLESSLGDVDR
jgi:hypothetical protein